MNLVRLWRIWVACFVGVIALCALAGLFGSAEFLYSYLPANLFRFCIAYWFLALLWSLTLFCLLGLLLLLADTRYSWSFRALWVVTALLTFSPFLLIAYWLCFVERIPRLQPRPAA